MNARNLSKALAVIVVLLSLLMVGKGCGDKEPVISPVEYEAPQTYSLAFIDGKITELEENSLLDLIHPINGQHGGVYRPIGMDEDTIIINNNMVETEGAGIWLGWQDQPASLLVAKVTGEELQKLEIISGGTVWFRAIVVEENGVFGLKYTAGELTIPGIGMFDFTDYNDENAFITDSNSYCPLIARIQGDLAEEEPADIPSTELIINLETGLVKGEQRLIFSADNSLLSLLAPNISRDTRNVEYLLER